MDPSGAVVKEGCEAMAKFCEGAADMLLHFAVSMGRAVFTAITHKHAKVRIAGIKALNAVLYCGVYKYNTDLMEMLVGFRDPNIVPIKDFYEPSTKLNYFAMLVQDRSTLVRECFYKTIADLLIKLPDRKDHEGRLFPYIISGIYDNCEEIQNLAFELIEEIGQVHEEENEKDFREMKQLGF